MAGGSTVQLQLRVVDAGHLGLARTEADEDARNDSDQITSVIKRDKRDGMRCAAVALYSQSS